MNSKSLRLLREWFKGNAASLPWRPGNLDASRDPYAVWISETMLQQTQVATVQEHFVHWLKRFPDIKTLAKAKEEEVFKYWQGLGYYSRARNILKTAKLVAGSTSQKLPESRKELEALPGIGAYTAGAILSLAYHQREAILDGNLVRIFSRLYALDFLPTDSKDAAETYWNYAREIANSSKTYMHNEAFMELGRTVCKVRSPLCEKCPLAKECKALQDARTEAYPPRKKHVQKDWHGTVLVVESADGKILSTSSGNAFLDGQPALPHFESPRGSTTGIPAFAESLFDTDSVSAVHDCGSFRHSITVHKIECSVLHILLTARSKGIPLRGAKQASARWIAKKDLQEAFANSFSLKALRKVF